MSEEDAADKTPSTKPRGGLGGPGQDYTPSDFVKALKGEFDGVRQDVAAQLSNMASKLEEHAQSEMTALDLISYHVKMIEADVDLLAKNYKRVNLTLEKHDMAITSHETRIEALEHALRELRARAEELAQELEALKAA